MPNEYSSYVKDESARRTLLEAADLPTELAGNGAPTLTFRNMRLHSAKDPLREAETLLESYHESILSATASGVPAPIVCMIYGPGLGYLITALNRFAEQHQLASRLRIVCIEVDPEVARKALQLRVWEPCSIAVEWKIGTPLLQELRAMNSKETVLQISCTVGWRLNRACYDRVAECLSPPSAAECPASCAVAERPMRILVPTPLYGGSYPMALHCAEALKRLGHHVELFDLSNYFSLYKHAEQVTGTGHHRRALQGILTTYLAELIAARAIESRADLVWAVAQTPLTPTALQELRHEGVHSAFWFVEDYRLFGYWRELAPHFDAVFTIQRGEFLEALSAAGVKHASYLPCAANPEIHHPLTVSDADRSRYGSPVSFVGAGYPNRQNLFSQLPLPGLKIWGNDWPAGIPAYAHVQEDGRRVTTEETAVIFAATDVNLNLHSSSHHVGVNPHGDFVNPRTFEIAACGAFQLVDARSELPELFEEGREIIVFRREEEIPDLVEHYAAHAKERSEIASNARARVLKEHTYEHRMSTALDYLEKTFRRLSERKRGPNYISSLKQAAGDDTELLNFLSAFSEEEEVDLDKIVARIQLGAGELSRPEGLFLLMKEFRDWGREKGVIQ
jgi:hypothetical protein